MPFEVHVIAKKTTTGPKPPATPPVGPGYLADLLRRMESDEEFPVPKGQLRTSEYTVKHWAFQEARQLNDPAVLPQAAEKVEQATKEDDFYKLAFVLAHFVKNTKNKQGGKLVDRLVERLPNKTRTIETVFTSLGHAPTAKVREFALEYIPHKNHYLEGCALDVLAAAAKPKDYAFLSELLASDRLHKGNLSDCVRAVAATGGKRAVGNLERFIAVHKKNRKWEYKLAVEWAEGALKKLNQA